MISNKQILHLKELEKEEEMNPKVGRRKEIVKIKVKSLSHVQLFVTPWTVAPQAPPSMGFSRQEYWSGMPLPLLLMGIRRKCNIVIGRAYW